MKANFEIEINNKEITKSNISTACLKNNDVNSILINGQADRELSYKLFINDCYESGSDIHFNRTPGFYVLSVSGGLRDAKDGYGPAVTIQRVPINDALGKFIEKHDQINIYNSSRDLLIKIKKLLGARKG